MYVQEEKKKEKKKKREREICPTVNLQSSVIIPCRANMMPDKIMYYIKYGK